MKKLWAVGDVHGHYEELIDLFDTLQKHGLDENHDTIVFLGDLVDGGPDTKKVLDWCMKKDTRENWIFLKGNHEDMMLDALLYQNRLYGNFYLWYNQGGKATAQSFLPTEESAYDRAIMQPLDYIDKEYLVWLHGRPLTFETDDYLFVHAGFKPHVPLDRQRQQDMLWIRDEFIDSEYDFGKTVVYGHTASVEPLIGHNKLCIDTMFHDRGKLTAVELGKDWKFYHQVARKGSMN